MATPSFFLTLGVLTIPVKAEAAALDKTISFRNLHAKCGATMSSQSVCVSCNEVVAKDQQVKGYPLGRDQFVKIDPKSIEALDVENTKAMEIKAFVPMKDVDAVYLGASSFLQPVDQPAAKAFELLRQAMAKRDRAAIVQYVASSREKLGLIRVYDGCLMLHEMFYQDEVRVAETRVKPVAVAPQELEVAVKLVKAPAAGLCPPREPCRRSFRWFDLASPAAVRESSRVKCTQQARAPPHQESSLA